MDKLEEWADAGDGRQYTAVRNLDGSALVVLVEVRGGVVEQVTKAGRVGLSALVDLALADFAEGKFLKEPNPLRGL